MTTDTAARVDGLMAPGPRSHPLWGHLPQMRKDPMGLLMESFLQYGDVVRLQLGEPMLLLNHPDHVKHVLQDNHTNYHKTYFYDRMRPVVGNGLITNDGESWLRQRRLAQPAFHHHRLDAMAAMFASVAGATVESWEATAHNGEPMDIHDAMMRLAMALVSRALFSMDVTREAASVGQALATCLEIGIGRFYSLFPIPLAVPTPENVRFNRATASLDKVINDIFAARRANPEKHDDLLSMLMKARDADTGDGMSDQQLRDEVMTLFLAGQETAANALSFMFHLLSTAPLVERRLYDEVRNVTDPLQMTKLPYLTMCFNEALRLYPPAWLLSRKAFREDRVGDYRIPAGLSLLLCPYTLHRHPAFWENPEAFDPERFSPEAEAKRPKMAFFPFGGGPRMCIGWNFAMMEAQIAITTILQRVKLNLVPGQHMTLVPAVSLRPAHPIMMTVHRR